MALNTVGCVPIRSGDEGRLKGSFGDTSTATVMGGRVEVFGISSSCVPTSQSRAQSAHTHNSRPPIVQKANVS